jgi:hypothetical protein
VYQSGAIRGELEVVELPRENGAKSRLRRNPGHGDGGEGEALQNPMRELSGMEFI